MAKPIQHSTTSTVADTASAGILRGTAGAILGGLVAAAIIGSGAALLVGVGASVLTVGTTSILGVATSGVGMIGAAVGMVLGAPVIGYGAAIGGGAGAIGGMMGRSGQIHDENVAAQNMGAGHKMQQQQQVSEARQQAATQYTKMGYAQGVQDGQVAVMQQLQAAQQQQMNGQMAMADGQAPAESKFADKILSERGEDNKVQLAATSHADKVKASQEQVGEASLSA